MLHKSKRTIALLIIALMLSLPLNLAIQINDNSISVTNLDEDSATITWTTDMQSDGYVDFGSSISKMYTFPETGGMTSYHSVNLENLDAGERYFYKVRSTDGYLDSDESQFMEFTTLASAPTNLVVEETGHNYVKLKWSGVQGAQAYRVFVNNNLVGESESSDFKVTGLLESEDYEAHVRTLDSTGRMSAKSNEVSFSTTVQPYNISFIDVTEITNVSAKITWNTDRSASSVVKYDDDMSLDKTKTDDSLKTSHTIELDNLEPNTRYYYSIVAGDSVSERKYFTTISSEDVGLITISNIQIVDASTDSVVIKWTTNIAANSEVRYGTDDTLGIEDGDDKEVTQHRVELEGLLSTQKYYFKVYSNGVGSAVQTFDTIASEDDFLSVDSLPDLVSNSGINISGKTRVNARVYIFTNDNPVAQVREVLNGTRFTFPIDLSSMVSYEDIQGNNKIQVVSWDQSGNKDTKTVNVVYDSIPPVLEIQGVPDITNKPSIDIEGVSEVGAELSFFLDNISQRSITSLSEEQFTHSLNLGRSGVSNVKIIAKDPAGNERVYEKNVLIDKDVPEFDFETEFGKATHFKLFIIRGTTEPGASISVVNWGVYGGCKEAYLDLEYTSCEQFLESNKLSYQLDPISYGVGMNRTVTADSDGSFEVVISLVRSGENTKDDLRGTTNNLEISVTDKAGNSHREMKKVIYQPGCSEWHVGAITSYPFNVYTKDIRAGDVTGSAFFPVRYLGPGVPTVREVTVFKDDAEHGFDITENVDTPDFLDDISQTNKVVDVDMNNDNQYITIGNPKATQYDSAKGAFYVYAPIVIEQYRGSLDTYPDELYAYLGVRIVYDTEEGSSGKCEIYPVVSYDIQKPEDISEWLSPEQINQTIQALTNMIEYTEDLIEVVRQASYFGLMACGAMVAWQYVAGFSKSLAGDTDKDENGCSENDRKLEKVYKVCDRVMCPSAPPKCDLFEPVNGDNAYRLQDVNTGEFSNVDGEEFRGQLETNAQYRNYYDNNVQGKTSQNFNEWVKSCQNAGRRTIGGTSINCPDNIEGTYQQTYYPTYETSISDPEQDAQYDVTMQIYEIDRHGDLLLPGSNVRVLDRDDGGSDVYIQTVVRELNTKAQKCAGTGGTLVVVTKESTPDATDIGVFEGVTVEEARQSKEYCGQTPDELMMDDDFANPDGTIKTNGIKGCYNPDCPVFDNTKCPDNPFNLFTTGGEGKAGINPAEGLWASIRCMCLPALLKHLENYLKIMIGAKKCLQQAQIGEIRGGLCERMLAQFICDLMIEAFKLIISTYGEGESESSGGAGGTARGLISNFNDNKEAISDRLGDRYSHVMDERMGLSSDQLVHKACIFGITGDWSVLDGMMEDFVDSVDVEPVYTMLAESRPYGYDPFTGTMSISYNIYVGVVPGGETDVRVVIECDPNADGGEYCGTDAPAQEVVVRHLTSDSDALNEEFVWTDDNALYWYNKATMYINFQVGDEYKSETLEKEIWRKGDLAYECYFSVMGGIKCPSVVNFGNANGLVELRGFGEGSFLLPQQNVIYRPGNPIPALVQLRNMYEEDSFYLRFDRLGISSNEGIEYLIPGSGQLTEDEGVYDYYYVFVDKIDMSQEENLGEVELVANQPTFSPNYVVTYPDATDNNGQAIVKTEGLDSMTAKAICSVKELGTKVNEIIIISKNENDLVNGINIDCFDNPVSGLSEGTKENKIVHISKFVVTNYHRNEGTPSSLGSYIYICNYKGEECKKVALYNPSSEPISQRSSEIQMNVLEDTGTGHGDTPILYDNAESQVSTETYSMASNSDVKNQEPIVELIEPIGKYWPGQDNVIIGLNIWDDYTGKTSYEFERLRLTIEGIGQVDGHKGDRCEWVYNPNTGLFNTDGTQSSCPFSIPVTGRMDYFGGEHGNSPPFFEIEIPWNSPTKEDLHEDAKYEVTITVTDKGKPETIGDGFVGGTSEISKPVTARFMILQKSQITTDLLRLNVGGDMCKGYRCTDYQTTNVNVNSAESEDTPQVSAQN